MKKRIILFLLFHGCLNGILAQQYVVYTMVGKPELSLKNGSRQLKLREKLTPASVIIIPVNSKIELFDEKNRKQYILKVSGKATTASHIKDSQNSVVDLTDRYFRYILLQIQGNNETVIRSCSDPATITREELTDSIYIPDS